MKNIITRSLINALGLLAYIILVMNILNNGEKIFGNMPKPIGGITFLLVFVFSALVSSLLVLGKPAMLFFDGHRKEGIRMLFYTIGWILVLIILLIIIRLLLSV